MKRSTIAKIALTGALAIAGVGFLMTSSVKHNLAADDLVMSELGEWQGREVTVLGWVKAGSIVEKVVNQETERTFLLRGSAGKEIRVFSVGPKPDTFVDNAGVVATGKIIPRSEMTARAAGLRVVLGDEMPYVVDATDLTAKCPSRYDGALSNRKLTFE